MTDPWLWCTECRLSGWRYCGDDGPRVGCFDPFDEGTLDGDDDYPPGTVLRFPD